MRSIDMSGAPKESFDSWTHVIIGAMLYGPKEAGYCGIEPGSEEDAAIMEWSTTRGVERSNAVLSVERKLRRLMREGDLLSKPIDVSVFLDSVERDDETGHLKNKVSKNN